MKRIMDWVRTAVAGGEAAQDTIEYVMAIGIVVVVMVLALLHPEFGFPALIRMGSEAICESVDTAPPTPTPTTCIVLGS